jgi:hypothetical protein
MSSEQVLAQLEEILLPTVDSDVPEMSHLTPFIGVAIALVALVCSTINAVHSEYHLILVATVTAGTLGGALCYWWRHCKKEAASRSEERQKARIVAAALLEQIFELKGGRTTLRAAIGKVLSDEEWKGEHEKLAHRITDFLLTCDLDPDRLKRSKGM